MKLKLDHDAFLMISESMHNADMYYATRFLAYDAFIYLNSKNEKLLVSDMELERAKKESRVRQVIPSSAYSIMEKLRKHDDADQAYCEMVAEFLASEKVKRVAVPYDFPLYLADSLREKGFEITPVQNPFREMRKIKNTEEIKAIEKAQRAGEKALENAVNVIKKAGIKNGFLWHEGKPLTSEDIRGVIEYTLIKEGCEAGDIIVACGKEASNPHLKGEGKLLANQPIVIDIVPRSRSERYYSDMTRSVVRGMCSEELRDMYSAVLDSQIAALKKIRAGVTGNEIHDIVCDLLEERGYETTRKKNVTQGFIHSTGHGVGLDIHEAPYLREGGEELQTGCVVTVEPGLYYRDIGGIRLEDVVVVTKKGCKNLTMFEKRLCYE